MDLTRLALPDESAHVIFCLHVIEHIREDTLAMSELYRVLKKHGIAFLVVPISIEMEKTEEFGRPNESWHGHYRLYGREYLDRLRDCGFVPDTGALEFVRTLDLDDCARYGIVNHEPLIVARKPA